jgi:hypothetical protein
MPGYTNSDYENDIHQNDGHITNQSQNGRNFPHRNGQSNRYNENNNNQSRFRANSTHIGGKNDSKYFLFMSGRGEWNALSSRRSQSSGTVPEGTSGGRSLARSGASFGARNIAPKTHMRSNFAEYTDVCSLFPFVKVARAASTPLRSTPNLTSMHSATVFSNSMTNGRSSTSDGRNVHSAFENRGNVLMDADSSVNCLLLDKQVPPRGTTGQSDPGRYNQDQRTLVNDNTGPQFQDSDSIQCVSGSNGTPTAPARQNDEPASDPDNNTNKSAKSNADTFINSGTAQRSPTRPGVPASSPASRPGISKTGKPDSVLSVAKSVAGVKSPVIMSRKGDESEGLNAWGDGAN